MDPSLLTALLAMQGGGQNPGAGGSPFGPTPGMMQDPSLGAMLTGAGYGGAGQFPGAGPSTSSAASPPVPWAPGMQPGGMGVNPVPNLPGTQMQGGPDQTGPMPGVSFSPGPIGSVPPGFNASTQSPGTTAGVTPGVPGAGVPSTQGQAGANPFGGLAGAKFPTAPNPIMPHAAPPLPGTHASQGAAGTASALASLLAALMPRTAQPAPYAAAPRFGA